jgi:hypothetical protein
MQQPDNDSDASYFEQVESDVSYFEQVESDVSYFEQVESDVSCQLGSRKYLTDK